jgi:type II secretory ATPase GspE/PulE/Tfp pilus assembly ATPase PilB-like protein
MAIEDLDQNVLPVVAGAAASGAMSGGLTSPVQERPGAPGFLRYGVDDAVVRNGDVTAEQFDVALRKKRALVELGHNIHVYDLLVRDRFLSRERAAELLGRGSNGDLQGAQALVPIAVCERMQVAPVGVESNLLVILSARPLTAREKDAIVRSCAVRVDGLRIMATDRADVAQRLRKLSSTVAGVSSILDEMRNADVTGSLLSQAIVAILTEALRARASDLHLDCRPDPDSWISYRIDGMLQQRHQLPERVMTAIFTRLKTDTGMDPSDSRRAQDGRMSMEFAGRHIDFRVASQPLAQGETIAMRVLDPESLPSIESLFPADRDMVSRLRAVASVHGKTGGLLLFSGPTGSGKTTTLYAVSQSFPRDRINVVTVEDPVEFTLPFGRQIQINQLLDERASDVERSILRQDPDVIVFGEIRDNDSARAALKFTESGHLVLATIHATTALQTFERFVSFFDESAKHEALFILAHSLRLLFNQRLVQRLCSCARLAVADDQARIAATLADTGITLPPDSAVRMRVGCLRCNHTGIFGRVLAFESLALAADETSRIALAGMLEASQSNFSRVTDLAGAHYQARAKSLSDLLAIGEIDPLAARRVLGM